MVLAAGLVLVQRPAVSVVADQGVVVALAALNRVRHRRSADDKTLVQDTRQVSQLFQLTDKRSLELVGDIRPKFKQHCAGIIRHGWYFRALRHTNVHNRHDYNISLPKRGALRERDVFCCRHLSFKSARASGFCRAPKTGIVRKAKLKSPQGAPMRRSPSPQTGETKNYGSSSGKSPPAIATALRK